jgi:type IV secretory pathway VirB4 component
MRFAGAQCTGHRSTTRHAQAIYPFMTAGGLGAHGAFIGRDASGGAFCFDPWVLYREGVLDDPNAIVLGKLGQGKSSLVKTLLWRMLLFGRRAFVLDVKREYGPLCQAAGVRPISLVPGGGVRLNPLASRPEEHAQLELLRAITVTALGGPLHQVEAAALREALRTVRDAGGSGGDTGAISVTSPGSSATPSASTSARAIREPTLPEIAAVLFNPVAGMAQRLQTTPQRLAADARRAALALQDLCEGPLRGMFDGPTTPGLDLDAKLLVLDLHAVRDSPAVGILMACATAWMSALLARMSERPDRERLINVADESWKIIQHTGLGEWFQSNFKLARQFGVMNLVVLHKLADLQAAGDAGSRAARIAEGLIADASTRIVYHQDESQIELTRTLLGLSHSESELLTMLSAGQALWRVGSRSFVVQHYRSRLETQLTDTDAGMSLTAKRFGRR